VPLDPIHFGLERYRTALYETLLAVLADFQVAGERDATNTGVHVRDRQIAAVGFAVKNWVAYFGCTLNVCLPPEHHDVVRVNPLRVDRKETCLLRERLSPVRPTAVRESFARNFAATLGFRTYYLCPPMPIVRAKRPQNVVAR
jgi:lipoate-protein ligase B